MNLYIYGSGRNGCEIIELARRMNAVVNRWQNIRFVDDVREERFWHSADVFRFDEMLRDGSDYECAISLGEIRHRKTLFEKLKSNSVKLATLVDPRAEVSPEAVLAEGCIVEFGSFVSCNAKLGVNVMVENQVVVGHDVEVGTHSVVSSGATIGGSTLIEEEVFIGLNCALKEKIKIGKNSILGMGAVVFNDVGEELIVMGNPARPLKKNKEQTVFN